MKNNVIQLVQNSHSMYDFDFESLLEMILDQEDDLDKPICKSARLDKDGKQYDEEFFSNRDGEIICGLILTSFKECEAFDGELNIHREIFVTRSGECLVFYATYEKIYDRNNDEEKNRVYRFFPTDQSLLEEEKSEAINELFYRHYKG